MDGGGVKPDIMLDLPEENAFLSFVDSNQLVFKYVNDYIFRKNPAYADSIGVVYEDYADFKDWFSKQHLEYVTELEKDWYAFVDQANEDGQLAALESQTSIISTQIAKEKENDLEEFESELRHRIEVELAGRYFYQSGKAKQTLAHDNEIKAAVELIRTPEKIKTILQN